jgi:hypothetical protein
MIPTVIVAKTTPLRMPTIIPTNVQVQRRRLITIAQDAAVLCRPKMFESQMNFE